MTDSFDFSEPAIRRMVEYNHTPHETWTVGGTLLTIACDACGHPWPCPTLISLREWEATRPDHPDRVPTERAGA